MATTDLEKLATDFHDWLVTRLATNSLAPHESLDSLLREYFMLKGIREPDEYVGNVKALHNGTVYQTLTDEIVRLGAKPKLRVQPELERDVLERYRTVPLHAIFLYTSEDNEVSNYILENWGALDTLSGDFCDIHPSIDQFRNKEDAYDFVEKLDVIRESKFNTYSELPGLFFWDNNGATEYVPFGNDFTPTSLKRVIRVVFEKIRKKPEISSVAQARKLLEKEIQMEVKNKSTHKGSIWSDLLAFLFAFVVIIGALVTASLWVSPIILGIVFISAILVFLIISALLLRRQSELSEANFMTLISEVIKRLPLLRRLPDETKKGE